MTLNTLAPQERRRIEDLLEKRWNGKVTKGTSWWISNKDKVIITNKSAGDFIKVYHRILNIQNAGFYIGMFERNNLRLSIEGAQLIGKNATKYTLEISEEECWNWLRGFDLDKEVEQGFIILTFKGDIVGVGNSKEGRILNTLPKERRIKNLKKNDL